MKRNVFLTLFAILMAAMMICFVSSCGSDDDEDENPLVGQWQECNSSGTLIDDETGYEVHHVIFRSNGTGEYWSVTKGKRDSGYSFDYSCSFDGSTSGVITEKRAEDKTSSCRFNFTNGILHMGEIYYKRVSS